MSNAIINVRIGLYHFQILKNWGLRISRNDFHRGYPNGRFAIYEFFGLERLWR